MTILMSDTVTTTTTYMAIKGIHQSLLTFSAGCDVGELILTYVGTDIIARRALVLSVPEANVVASSEAWPQLGTPTIGEWR